MKVATRSPVRGTRGGRGTVAGTARFAVKPLPTGERPAEPMWGGFRTGRRHLKLGFRVHLPGGMPVAKRDVHMSFWSS